MKRLTDKHPTSIKVEKLFALADELGISINVSRYGQLTVSDEEFPGTDFFIRDNEGNGDVFEFPPVTEYKLITY